MNLLIRFLLLFLILVPCAGHSQFRDSYKLNGSDRRQVKRSVRLYERGKFTPAIEKIAAVQRTHLLNPDLWQLRIIYENARYNYHFGGEREVGREWKYTSKDIKWKNSLILQCRKATMYCANQELASLLLYNLTQEAVPDTFSSVVVKVKHNLAWDLYYQGKTQDAIDKFMECLGVDSNCIQAIVALGDIYYTTRKFVKAEEWYIKATTMYPERWKYWYALLTLRIEMQKPDQAIEACIGGIAAYPFEGFFRQLQTLCEEKHYGFDRHWVPRLCFPNSMKNNADTSLAAPWDLYQDCKRQMSSSCSREGVITGEIGVNRFLEIYSWKHLLAEAKGDLQLNEAQKMQEAGYLDCYVFVSQFHIDVVDQYNLYAYENRERIKTYIRTMIIKK